MALVFKDSALAVKGFFMKSFYGDCEVTPDDEATSAAPDQAPPERRLTSEQTLKSIDANAPIDR
jgi:hypothetical protein